MPKEKKQYLPIGYGGPNTGGRGGFPVDGRFGQDGGLFDLFFEKLGIKKKKRERSEGERITIKTKIVAARRDINFHSTHSYVPGLHGSISF